MFHHWLLLTILSVTVGSSMSWKITPPRSHSNGTGGHREQKREADPFNLIYPGTYWCGSGSNAPSDDALGWAAATDACCRAHDKCADIIEAGQTEHGLTNYATYTRLSCKCDLDFHACLHNSDEWTASGVGSLYFDVLDTQCYRNEHPIVGCKRKPPHSDRCLEYKLDKSKPKQYQWFDVPFYD